MHFYEYWKDGKHHSVDLHDLPIAGTLAHKLTSEDLFKELRKLGLPVKANMGHHDLSIALAEYLEEAAA